MKKLFMLLLLLIFCSTNFLDAQIREGGSVKGRIENNKNVNPSRGREDNFFRDFDLIKGRGDRIYIVIDHEACWIPNMDVFNEMRLDWNAVRRIDDSKLDRMQKGNLIFRNHSGNYYANLDGRIAEIGNVSMFHALDLDEKYVINLPDRIISRFSIVRLVIGSRRDQIYLVDGRRIYEMRSDKVLKAFGLYPEDILRVNERVLGSFNMTPLLLKGRGDKIYLVEDGKCRWITSPESFRRNNFDMNMVMRVDDRTIKEIPEGRPLN